MIRYLINTARPLIFSTAPSPPAVAGALAALALLRERPQRVQRLRSNARVLRRALAAEGFPVADSGDADRAADRGRGATRRCACARRRSSAACSRRRIRPPTVPAGSSRLRLTAMASHTASELRDGGEGVRRRPRARSGSSPASLAPALAERERGERASASWRTWSWHGGRDRARRTPNEVRGARAVRPRARCGTTLRFQRPKPRRPPLSSSAPSRRPPPQYRRSPSRAPRSTSSASSTASARPSPSDAGAGHARAVRNGDRHGRRQDSAERGAAGGDGGGGRAGARVQAGGDGPRGRGRNHGTRQLARRPRAARRRPRGWRPRRSRRCASARRSRRTWRRSWRESGSTRLRLVAGARAGRARGRTLVVEGVGGLLVPLRAELQRVRPRGRARAAGADRRAPGPGHDQPHAADAASRARDRTGRARGRAHAVAGGALGDRALQPRDDRAASARSRCTRSPGSSPPNRAELARAGEELPWRRWLQAS